MGYAYAGWQPALWFAHRTASCIGVLRPKPTTFRPRARQAALCHVHCYTSARRFHEIVSIETAIGRGIGGVHEKLASASAAPTPGNILTA
jgi:hypothetical protein